MQDFTCPKNIPLSLSSPILLSCSQRDNTEQKTKSQNLLLQEKLEFKLHATLQNGLVVLKQLKQLFYLHHKDILVHFPITIPATLKSNYLLRY